MKSPLCSIWLETNTQYDIRNTQHEIRNTNLHADFKAVRHKAAVSIKTFSVWPSKARRTAFCFLDTVDKFCLFHFSRAYAKPFCLAFYFGHIHSFFLCFCCWHSLSFLSFLRPGFTPGISRHTLTEILAGVLFYHRLTPPRLKLQIPNSVPAYSFLPAFYSSCSSPSKSII